MELPSFPDRMIHEIHFDLKTHIWFCRLCSIPTKQFKPGHLEWRFAQGWGATPELALAAANKEWDTPFVYKRKSIASGDDLLKELGL